MKRFLATFLILSVLGSLSLAATSKAKAEKAVKSVAVTGFFADMPQSDFKGKPISYTKKLYLVDIWASWCPPCRMTIPELNRLQQKIGSAKFGVIGFSVDNAAEAVVSYAKEQPFAYPVAWISKKQVEKFPPVRGIPTMFIMDNKGTILQTLVGYTPMEDLETAVMTHLGK